MNNERTSHMFPTAGRKGSLRPGARALSIRPDRRKKKKGCTKAELRRRVRAHRAHALAQIAIANRIAILPEKKSHLEAAITHLEAVLAEQGGNHPVRRQLAICRERLWEMERGTAATQPLEIIVPVR